MTTVEETVLHDDGLRGVGAVPGSRSSLHCDAKFNCNQRETVQVMVVLVQVMCRDTRRVDNEQQT